MNNVHHLKIIKFSKAGVILTDYLMKASNNGQKVITMTDPELAEATKLSIRAVITQLTKLNSMGIIRRESHHRFNGCDRKITFNANRLGSIIKIFPGNSLREIMFNDTEIKLIQYLDEITHQGKRIVDTPDAEINEVLKHSCAASLRHLDSLGIVSRDTVANGYRNGGGRSRLIKYNASKVNDLVKVLEGKVA